MKKLLFIGTILVGGMLSAASLENKLPVENKIDNLSLSNKVARVSTPLELIIERGIFAYDSPTEGTCFVYGTLITNPDNGYQSFMPGTDMQRATIAVPPCTGFNKYLC